MRSGIGSPDVLLPRLLPLQVPPASTPTTVASSVVVTSPAAAAAAAAKPLKPSSGKAKKKLIDKYEVNEDLLTAYKPEKPKPEVRGRQAGRRFTGIVAC